MIFASTPRMYGLIKLHKPGHALRPICSSINGPTSQLARYLHETLRRLENETYYIKKNSFEFVESIQTTIIPLNCNLISLDVKSLFTNISLNLVLLAVKDKWTQVSDRTSILLQEYFKIVEMCYTQSNFAFNNKNYFQNCGIAMRTSFVPFIANLAIDTLLSTKIQTLPFDIPYIKKYIDDLIFLTRYVTVSF